MSLSLHCKTCIIFERWPRFRGLVALHGKTPLTSAHFFPLTCVDHHPGGETSQHRIFTQWVFHQRLRFTCILVEGYDKILQPSPILCNRGFTYAAGAPARGELLAEGRSFGEILLFSICFIIIVLHNGLASQHYIILKVFIKNSHARYLFDQQYWLSEFMLFLYPMYSIQHTVWVVVGWCDTIGCQVTSQDNIVYQSIQ